jgi:hypothetical protein
VTARAAGEPTRYPSTLVASLLVICSTSKVIVAAVDECASIDPAVAGAAAGYSVVRACDLVPRGLAAVPVRHTDRKAALFAASAALGCQPSLLQCSAFALFARGLSAILAEERPLHFQLRQDST